MSAEPRSRHRPLAAALIAAAGVLVLLLGWLVPANVRSVDSSLLPAAGRGTTGLVELGRNLLASEKPGPAMLVHQAATTLGIPGAEALGAEISAETAARPETAAWGGWDPFLDPLLNETPEGTAEFPGVLPRLLPEKARNAVNSYLSGSRSSGVRSLLKTRELTSFTRFIPARQPGGQPLDAVILLTALLYQGEHFTPDLQREIKQLADAASHGADPAPLELFFMDLLSLAKRLNWIQLSELLRTSGDTATVGQFAHLAKVSPPDLAEMYAAALLSRSPDRVASYLIRHGRAGLADLREALLHGEGAVRLLLARSLPLSHQGPRLGPAASVAVLHPRVVLGAKCALYLAGALLLFMGINRGAGLAMPSNGLPAMKTSVLALLTAGLFFLMGEPFMLRAAPPSEFAIRIAIPILTFQPGSPLASTSPTLAMDLPTILSILLFACIQVTVYLICLLKIRDVERSSAPSLLKLRLMENEENLFDSGLYVGIAGTATALVLQVLGLIEPNLLAAYSSNLFGITTVALIKIRHVRPYKRKLILEDAATRGMTIG